VSFGPGDQFGARAYANGTLEVYKNGVKVGTTDVSGWTYAAQGGHLGITLDQATGTHLDDFGGGNIVLNNNTAPTAIIQSPSDGAFYVVGDQIQLTGTGTDGQQTAATLQYDWDVWLHHNTHVHPGSYLFSGPTASFPAENHDDGTGVHYEVFLIVTDSGSLRDTTSVEIWPEIDLTPSPVTVTPETPGTLSPAEYRFWIRNLGRMPAPYSRWRLRADNTLLAEGDTLVAPLDSVEIVKTLPPTLAAGTYALRAVVDTLAAVVETVEGNNAQTRQLTVVTGSVDVEPGSGRLWLSAGRPNPTQGAVSFALELPRAARVGFEVHDIQGRKVWSERDHELGPGAHQLRWNGRAQDGSRLGAGLYLVRVRAEGQIWIRRVAMVR
jgi:hypothetical protein